MSNHSISHFEIASTDPKVSGKFYSELFGWQTFEPEPGYIMFQTEAGPTGAIVNTTNEGDQNAYFDFKPDTVLVYVATNDVDASLAKAESLGGKTLCAKTEVPGFGWFGIFADPVGNKIGLFQHSAQEA